MLGQSAETQLSFSPGKSSPIKAPSVGYSGSGGPHGPLCCLALGMDFDAALSDESSCNLCIFACSPWEW